MTGDFDCAEVKKPDEDEDEDAAEDSFYKITHSWMCSVKYILVFIFLLHPCGCLNVHIDRRNMKTWRVID